MRSTTTTTAVAPAEPIVGNTESNDPNNNNCTRTTEAMRNWIDAPEFVPRYITTQNSSCDEIPNQASNNDNQGGASRLVKPFSQNQLTIFIQLISFPHTFHGIPVNRYHMLKLYRETYMMLVIRMMLVNLMMYRRQRMPKQHYAHTFKRQLQNPMVQSAVNMVIVVRISMENYVTSVVHIVFIPPIKINERHIKRYVYTNMCKQSVKSQSTQSTATNILLASSFSNYTVIWLKNA